jgi:hypothetical protein
MDAVKGALSARLCGEGRYCVAGEPVGVAETEAGDWIVYFTDHPIGLIDRRTRTLRPFGPARPGRPQRGAQTNPGNCQRCLRLLSTGDVSEPGRAFWFL